MAIANPTEGLHQRKVLGQPWLPKVRTAGFAPVVIGEAGDSGDKATPKAMSVALRTALLQTLMLPTDEPDPDSFTYGADDGRPAAPEGPSQELVQALLGMAPGGVVPIEWVREQAAAHGYDMMNGAQMGELLAELRSEANGAAK